MGRRLVCWGHMPLPPRSPLPCLASCPVLPNPCGSSLPDSAELGARRGVGAHHLLCSSISPSVWLCAFPGAAGTDDHKPGGLKQQECVRPRTGAEAGRLESRRGQAGPRSLRGLRELRPPFLACAGARHPCSLACVFAWPAPRVSASSLPLPVTEFRPSIQDALLTFFQIRSQSRVPDVDTAFFGGEAGGGTMHPTTLSLWGSHRGTGACLRPRSS